VRALARRQGAHIFEIRCAADAFRLAGEPARTDLKRACRLVPAEQTWPDLADARALLR
jgi:hypothetical protein